MAGHVTYHYKRACTHYRLVLSPETFKSLGTQSMCRYQDHLVCPCHRSLLPSIVHNTLALVNITHAHTSGHALSISVKPGSATHFPTSTASAGLQCLLACACVHLVWFRAVSHLMWPLPCTNIFHASQI